MSHKIGLEASIAKKRKQKMMKNSLEAQICSNTQLQPKKSSTQKIENIDTCFLSCARNTEQYDRFVALTENKRE